MLLHCKPHPGSRRPLGRGWFVWGSAVSDGVPGVPGRPSGRSKCSCVWALHGRGRQCRCPPAGGPRPLPVHPPGCLSDAWGGGSPGAGGARPPGPSMGRHSTCPLLSHRGTVIGLGCRKKGLQFHVPETLTRARSGRVRPAGRGSSSSGAWLCWGWRRNVPEGEACGPRACPAEEPGCPSAPGSPWPRFSQ